MAEVVNLLEMCVELHDIGCPLAQAAHPYHYRLLLQVQEKMRGWLTTGRFRQFVLQDDILQDVKLCNEWVDDTLSKLTARTSCVRCVATVC
jgi:hypothetical protein